MDELTAVAVLAGTLLEVAARPFGWQDLPGNGGSLHPWWMRKAAATGVLASSRQVVIAHGRPRWASGLCWAISMLLFLLLLLLLLLVLSLL